jgi:hypothetical protein
VDKWNNSGLSRVEKQEKIKENTHDNEDQDCPFNKFYPLFMQHLFVASFGQSSCSFFDICSSIYIAMRSGARGAWLALTMSAIIPSPCVARSTSQNLATGKVLGGDEE